MEIDEKYLSRVLKIVMRAIAHERIENYAPRILLTDSGDAGASIDIQNKARELAAKRYEKLLRLIDNDHGEQADLMNLLRDFETLLRRE